MGYLQQMSMEVVDVAENFRQSCAHHAQQPSIEGAEVRGRKLAFTLRDDAIHLLLQAGVLWENSTLTTVEEE